MATGPYSSPTFLSFPSREKLIECYKGEWKMFTLKCYLHVGLKTIILCTKKWQVNENNEAAFGCFPWFASQSLLTQNCGNSFQTQDRHHEALKKNIVLETPCSFFVLQLYLLINRSSISESPSLSLEMYCIRLS